MPGGVYPAVAASCSGWTSESTPPPTIRVFRAEIRQDDGTCELSTAERNFCSRCATALWLFSTEWPDLVHPFASAIDSELPKPPRKVHLMLKYKANWVEPDIGRGDETFELYPKLSIADWHHRSGMWVD